METRAIARRRFSFSELLTSDQYKLWDGLQKLVIQRKGFTQFALKEATRYRYDVEETPRRGRGGSRPRSWGRGVAIRPSVLKMGVWGKYPKKMQYKTRLDNGMPCLHKCLDTCCFMAN